MGRLAPLSEEPINGEEDSTNSSKKGRRGLTWRNWIKTLLSLVFNKKSDLRILLSLLGCPLFPIRLHLKQSIINEGLDPLAIAAVFSSAQQLGEKRISGVDCFALKLSAEQTDLAERGDKRDDKARYIRLLQPKKRAPLLLGGLLLDQDTIPWGPAHVLGNHHVHENRGLSDGGGCDDRPRWPFERHHHTVRRQPEGSSAITRMEETWTIDDLAFNVPGLSIDWFIPPTEVHRDYPGFLIQRC